MPYDSDVVSLLQDLEELGSFIPTGLHRANIGAAREMASALREGTPFATGKSRDAWTAPENLAIDDRLAEVRLTNPTMGALIAHTGAEKHFTPPKELVPWVELKVSREEFKLPAPPKKPRKGMDAWRERAIRGIAFCIGRKHSQEDRPSTGYVERAWEKVRPVFERLTDAVFREGLRRFASGGR